MTFYSPITLKLDNGKFVPAVTISPMAQVTGLTTALKLPPLRGAIAIVGGAGSFDTPDYAHIRQQTMLLFHEVADLALSQGLAVVDGGTPFGVIKLIGQVCFMRGLSFPLVGVAPSGMVTWNANEGIDYQKTWFQGITLEQVMKMSQNDLTPLDPNHAAFVLVQANEWGGEVEKLAEVTFELNGSTDAVEILVNGGDVARLDVIAFLKRGGKVLCVDGSGRFADTLAQAVRAGHSIDPAIDELVKFGQIELFKLGDSPQLFSQKLRQMSGWR